MFSRTKVINIVLYHLCETRTCVTRARFGRKYPLVALNQYTRATLNAVSWSSESKWPNDLKGRGHFQDQLNESQDAFLIQI